MSETPLVIDPSLPVALSVNDATFQWQQVQEPEGKKGRKKSKAVRRKGTKGKVKYYVDWEGFGPEARTWEPAEGLTNAKKKIDAFHDTHPDKPRTIAEWNALKPKRPRKKGGRA